MWQSLFLAAPEFSQAGHIATALHPGPSALVWGSHIGTSMYAQLTSWDNLLLAYRCASKGKRSQPGVAAFEYRLEDHLLALQEALRTHTYRPGAYTHFFIHEPKRQLISAAPFRDLVVHHTLCNLIEPIFERTFVTDSYANRRGKGTHRALQRIQDLARQYPYVLQCDLRQFSPVSIRLSCVASWRAS